MKTILKRILPVCMLVTLMTLSAAAQGRIGTIDLRKVFEDYWKRQRAEAALKEHGAELDKQYKSYLEDYNKTNDDYKKLLEAANDQSVTLEEREKRKSAAETKLVEIKSSENSIRQFQAKAQEDLGLQQKRMRDTILQEIRTAINAKAKVGGYSLVIDIAGETVNNTPVVLFSNGENDLTDTILAQLNAGAPPVTPTETPAEPAKTPDKKK
jgi:outer membrane protein